MQKRIFLLIWAFGALVVGSSAQTNNFQNLSTLSPADTPDRPRRAAERSSGVKSVVVVKTLDAEQAAFALINQKRAENGLGPLLWNDDVAVVARMHSQNMADLKFFGHRGVDNKMVSDRADSLGIKKWRAIGENIAFNRGYQDPTEKAVDLWLNSPSHRRNMMDDNWAESAVGVAVAADGSYYFTQVFLKRK